MKKSIVGIALLVLGLAGGAVAEDYIIGAGDQLKVDVWGVAALSGQMVVRPDGKITLPAVGDVEVAGMSPSDVAKKLNEAFTEFVKQPRASVTVLTVTNNRVYLAGDGVVSRVVSLPDRTTLFRFLVSVGELRAADLESAYVLRGGKEIYRDFRKLLLEGCLSEDLPLRADDIVFLPSNERNKIYVLGAVLTPKMLPKQERLTVLDAILACGGFAEFADKEKVRLVRKGAPPVEVPVGDIQRGTNREANVLLQPGDQVVVSSFVEDKIYVSGAVTAPRTIVFEKNMKVLDAVYAAQGFNGFANSKKVMLFRAGEPKQILNLKEVLEGSGIEQNVSLRPGDHIVVPESLF